MWLHEVAIDISLCMRKPSFLLRNPKKLAFAMKKKVSSIYVRDNGYETASRRTKNWSNPKILTSVNVRDKGRELSPYQMNECRQKIRRINLRA